MSRMKATVEAGGFLRVPYPEGTEVEIEAVGLSKLTQEEWTALVRRVSGSIPDFELPEDDAPSPIVPISIE